METKHSQTTLKGHMDTVAIKLDSTADKRLQVILQNAADRDDNTRTVAEKERLLLSFKFDRMNERRNQLRESFPKTFDWVLRDDDEVSGSQTQIGSDTKKAKEPPWDSFSNWLKLTEPSYWISGKPGSGKSTLMRYLVAAQNTQRYLTQWMPGSVVVSHFFWRPGTVIQQSLKGLLLSLLHQILCADDTILDATLKQFPEVLKKDDDADWAESELHHVLEEVLLLSCTHQAVVFFIDGLDEVWPKDALRVMDFIEKLESFASRTGRVKLCLASRPEPFLSQKLGHYPRLRLEKLNLSDLRRYAASHLSVPEDYDMDLDEDARHRLAPYWRDRGTLLNAAGLSSCLRQMLVQSAEGIFLWLCLTVDTVVRALQVREPIRDIICRVESLPGDLSELYADMWDRANGDSDQQKERAAFYLQTVLQPWYSEAEHVWDMIPPQFSQLHLMLASNPILERGLLDTASPRTIAADTLAGAWARTKADVLARCAGLLRAPTRFEPRNFKLNYQPRYGQEYAKLACLRSVESQFKFIHRTAQDFLCDTDSGQQILAHNKKSTAAILLAYIRSSLAICRLFRSDYRLETPEGYLERVRGLSDHVRVILAYQELASNDEVSQNLLPTVRLLEKMFQQGLVRPATNLIKQSIQLHRYHPGLLVTYERTVMRDDAFVLEYSCRSQYDARMWRLMLLLLDGTQLRTTTLSQVLGYTCASRRFVNEVRDSDFLAMRHDLVQKLLAMGASGILASTLCHRNECTWEPAVWVSQTPLEALLAATWAEATTWALDPDDYLSLEKLVLLLVKHGANIEQEIRCTVKIDRHRLTFGTLFEGSRHKRCSRNHISIIIGLSAGQILAIFRKHIISTTDDDAGHLAHPYNELLDSFRVLAVVQCRVPKSADHILWLLAKSDILLPTPQMESAIAFRNVIRYTLHCLFDMRERPVDGPTLFIHRGIYLPPDVQNALNEAVKLMRDCVIPITARRWQLRMLLGVETRTEDFEYGYSRAGGRRFTTEEMMQGRLLVMSTRQRRKWKCGLRRVDACN